MHTGPAPLTLSIQWASLKSQKPLQSSDPNHPLHSYLVTSWVSTVQYKIFLTCHDRQVCTYVQVSSSFVICLVPGTANCIPS